MASDEPRSIVTYVHRPKRSPRKKAQAAEFRYRALE